MIFLRKYTRVINWGTALTIKAVLANRQKCSYADLTYQTCSSLVLTNLMAGSSSLELPIIEPTLKDFMGIFLNKDL